MAVVEHIGGPGGGHYFTYRRVPMPVPDSDSSTSAATAAVHEEPLWVHCNDHSVSPVSLRTVLHKQAYMLFYVQRSALEPSERGELAATSLVAASMTSRDAGRTLASEGSDMQWLEESPVNLLHLEGEDDGGCICSYLPMPQ
jgi:hypothetical protein